MSNRLKLVVEIKSHLRQAARSLDDAEHHYREAGARLAKLKGQKGEIWTGRWDVYVRKQFDLSQDRADELIRIATGRTTVAETRSRTKNRVKKHRAKSLLRNSDYLHPSEKSYSKTGNPCDFNGEDPEDVAEPGDSMEIIRRRIFLYRTSEVLRHAEEHGFDVADDSEIDREIINAAKACADAWIEVHKQLVKRHAKEKRNGKKTTSASASIH
jgi:hypothetical protein